MTPPPHPITRSKPPYLISTSPTLLSASAINAAFALPALYWCKPLPLPTLPTLLSNSLCVGLYIQSPPPTISSIATAEADESQYEQIGLARLITDHVTFAYLTDVYVLPEHQGQGLGKWLISAVDEILEGMEVGLRRALLITGEGVGERFYERELGMKRMGGEGGRGLVVMSRKGGGSGF